MEHMLSNPVDEFNPQEERNEPSIDLMNPLGSIRTEWKKDHALVTDPVLEEDFIFPYNNRTEGEIASALVDMLEYLRSKH